MYRSSVSSLYQDKYCYSIDQLDKADSPPIPDSYIYLLGVQCIVSLCEGFASFTAPLYTSIVVQRPRAAGDPVIRAPPSLDLATLPPDEPATRHLRIVRSMVDSGWPALLAALSFIISTNLSDELFVDVLTSYQAMTNVAGMLALTTPRDAFLTSLAKFATPSRVVASLESYVDPPTPRSGVSLTENLGLIAPVQPPGLSERNLVCLKVLVSSALFLAGSLGESWYGIMEALQNADYVLTMKGSQPSSTRRPSTFPGGPHTPARAVSGTSSISEVGKSSHPPQPARHPLLADVDPDNVQLAIQRLFDASKNLEDTAFQDFVNALCKLSSEMIGMQSDAMEPLGDGESTDELAASIVSTTLSPRNDLYHRRRVSGIHLPRTLVSLVRTCTVVGSDNLSCVHVALKRSGDFGVERLGTVAMLNIHRLIYRAPEIAWNTTTGHLLSIVSHPSAPQAIRVQAARVLDEILVTVPRNLSSTGDLQAQAQRRVLDVLSKQIVPASEAGAASTSTNVELRRMGLEALHQILQASGHTLVGGWGTIFEMLGSVCKPPVLMRTISSDSVSTLSLQDHRPKPLSLGYNSERGYTALVKIAFQSLKLVCDSVSSLSPEDLRLCISTLGQFGRQADTNIALTAAESLLWSVSDSIQSKRKDAEEEPEYSALWMFLLLEVLGLCTDARPEVRVGAIQTLFRAMQLYGATLSLNTWNDCMWKITFPLLDAISVETRRTATENAGPPSAHPSGSTPDQAWDESKSLALQSIGSIIKEFVVSKIMHLSTFPDAWKVFVAHVQNTVLLDRRSLSTPALQCLDKAIGSLLDATDKETQPRIADALECAWQAWDDIGREVLQGGTSQFSPRHIGDAAGSHRAFTQESLVAFLNVVQTMRRMSRQHMQTEWSLARLTRLMEILRGGWSRVVRVFGMFDVGTVGVLTYPHSPDYRPDVDTLTPVQVSENGPMSFLLFIRRYRRLSLTLSKLSTSLSRGCHHWSCETSPSSALSLSWWDSTHIPHSRLALDPPACPRRSPHASRSRTLGYLKRRCQRSSSCTCGSRITPGYMKTGRSRPFYR